MYYEAITEVLPGVKLFIDTSEGGTEKLLPIESFVDNSGNSAADRRVGE